jgi:glycerophosphoryl diester phosphodiesterase
MPHPRSTTAPQRCPVEIVCHKGANEYAPENTYASAQLCLDWGMDYVEIDVNMSKDGVFYILHGPTVDETTDGTGNIADMAADEIDRLDAGSWFDPGFADERIPRLEPFLRWIKGRAKLFLDVKRADLKRLITLVYETGFEDDCFFWFGDDHLARQFQAMAPTLALKINVSSVEDVILADEEYQANIIEVELDKISQALVDACRRRGLKIMIRHEHKDPDAFRDVLRWGADMINLDHGDLFLKVAAEFVKEA